MPVWFEYECWIVITFLGTSTVLTTVVFLSSSSTSFFFFLVGWDWVHLVRRPLIGRLYQARMMVDNECGAVGGIRIGSRNRSTRSKPATAPLCPPQIRHHMTWARTRAAAVGSRRLTAWAMARPSSTYYIKPVRSIVLLAKVMTRLS
jgi:hypothetical protein